MLNKIGKLVKRNRLISLDSSSYRDSSDSGNIDYSSYIFDYLILNIAVFFVYTEVIYKNAIYSPYLFLYYLYAQIGINIDPDSFLKDQGYIQYFWINYMAVFATVLTTELGISD